MFPFRTGFRCGAEPGAEMERHPARESLEWLAELDALLARRPENFNRAMTPPEKKLLEAMLERGLGVQRKKPAVKKAAAKKAETTKPAAKKTAPAKKAAAKSAKRPASVRPEPF